MFFGADFIAVTKSGSDWQQLKPIVLGAIMEHFVSGEDDPSACDIVSESRNWWTGGRHNRFHRGLEGARLRPGDRMPRFAVRSVDQGNVRAGPRHGNSPGIRHPRYLAWRKKIPWLRYGYTPHLVPWLKANANRYDAIVVHGLWNYAALGSRRALVRGKTPYFVYAHGMLDPYFNRANPLKAIAKQISWWFSEGRLIANARNVFFTTEEERRLARHSFWPFRCRERVVPYGTQDIAGNGDVQIATFRAALPRLAGRRFILFLSRIHPKKGCDLLIQAFAKAAAKDPALDLVMAGPESTGFGKELRNIAAELGVADRIHWPGMLKDDLKWGAFRAAEAFILPSHQENFGIVIGEAMACGKPVLTTDKVNTWREVQDSGAGLVANDDLEGITRLLEQFLDLPPPEEKQAMGQRARQGFVEKFDIGTMGSRLMQALWESAAA